MSILTSFQPCHISMRTGEMREVWHFPTNSLTHLCMHSYAHATRCCTSINGLGEDNNNNDSHAFTGFPNVTVEITLLKQGGTNSSLMLSISIKLEQKNKFRNLNQANKNLQNTPDYLSWWKFAQLNVIVYYCC